MNNGLKNYVSMLKIVMIWTGSKTALISLFTPNSCKVHG